MSHSLAIHAGTPCLAVIEPRGLQVRSVTLHRAQDDEPVSERIDRSAYDAAGRLAKRWDARLWAISNSAPGTRSHLTSIYSLAGRQLFSDSIDAGWRVELFGEAGQNNCRWNARGHSWRAEYDLLLRSVAVFENDGICENCTERLIYGGADATHANQCGQSIRHDDPTGSVFNNAFNLSGAAVEQSRHFLRALAQPDWPETINERDELLESDTGAKSSWRFGPLGDATRQTDAMGNVQFFAQTIAGQLKSMGLQLRDQCLKTWVSDIHYNAHGRIESETAGNGVVTTMEYDESNGRLVSLRADAGRLQDLNYAYDPVGNVICIEDRAQPARHFASQRIEPLRTFVYDTLYQLIEATGYEAAITHRGPANGEFRRFSTANELSNYIQRYEYDAGGNLQKLIHVGAQNHTRSFATAQFSNRSLLQTGDQPPSEEQIASGFDSNGNLRELQPGQTLSWDGRNQLIEVTPVERDSGANDSEIYCYDAAGTRMRKVRSTQAKAITHLNEVRYLPGLELRTNTATGEELHIITATAGHSQVRMLRWQAGCPSDLDNDQVRYSLTDHLGSNTLELNTDAQLISQEIFYPYGGTAWFAGRSEVEVKYKTVRYSGKERDATGLYYYGLRYYAPWLMRWINPDPAGESGGINLFRFCNNSPIKFADAQGAAPYDVLGFAESQALQMGWTARSLGLAKFGQQIPKMLDALKISSDYVAQAKAKLSAPVWDVPAQLAMDSVFGSSGYQSNQRLRNAFLWQLEKIGAFLDHLKNDGQWRLNIANAPENLIDAVTLSNSEEQVERVIYFNRSYFESSDTIHVASTLIHESTHAVPDLMTADFFYLPVDRFNSPASEQTLARYVGQLVNGSRAIASSGPDESRMNWHDAQRYRTLLSPIVSEMASADARRAVFVNTSDAVAVAASWNADSLMAAVMIANFPLQPVQPRAKSSQPTSKGSRSSGFKRHEVF